MAIPDSDESLLVARADLRNAVRLAFRAPARSPTARGAERRRPLSAVIARRHDDAVRACARLSEQFARWEGQGSVAVDRARGVRVAATSHLLARHADQGRYTFSYRIRVENIGDMLAEQEQKEDEARHATRNDGDNQEAPKAEAGAEPDLEHRAVQLLGRKWNISELVSPQTSESSSSLLQRLLEEGVLPEPRAAPTAAEDDAGAGAAPREAYYRLAHTVNQPRGGAVGHFPVIYPGEVFEYMSGTDLGVPRGVMAGEFCLARVPDATASAHTGEATAALAWPDDDPRRFRVPVAPFGLVGDEGEE